MIIPTGVERVVQPHELIFSVTTPTGVITDANHVFFEISRYPHDEVVGAPHNIVRHPDMPSGLFALLWERLREGKSAAAYLKSLASDGSTYWTFAIITPLGTEGFVSVQTAVMRRDVWAQVVGVYRQAYEIEQVARSRGSLPAVIAQIGKNEIFKRHQFLDFEDYTAVMRAILPVEVAALSTVSRPVAEMVAPTELESLAEGIRIIDGEVLSLASHLDGYLALARSLRETSVAAAEVTGSLSTSSSAAVRASQTLEGSAPVLVLAGEAATHFAQDASDALHSLAPELYQLESDLLSLRFRISLAQTYNDMVAVNITEIHDGVGESNALNAVPLIRALSSLLNDVDARLAASAKALFTVADSIDDAGGSLQEFQRMLITWRQLVAKFQLTGKLSEYLAPIDAQVAAGREQLASLGQLAMRCRTHATPVETQRLHAGVTAINTTVTALVGEVEPIRPWAP